MYPMLKSRSRPWTSRFAQGDRGQARHRGFTLIEILLVLAMMALVGAVLLPAAGALFRQGRQVSPADAVADVLQDVRREAVLSGRPVSLRFERGTQQFAWDAATGSPAEASAKLGGTRALEGPEVTIEFLRPAITGAVLVGGRVIETNTVDRLTFYPDGTCDPVRIQVRPAHGEAQVLSIDPWTCAPGLEVAS